MLSLYVAATWIGVILGKLLFSAMLAGPFDAFAICSIAVSAALIPVVLTNGSAPSIPPATRAEVPALLRGAPVAAAGAFAVGAMNGPFWTLAPHFAGVRTGSNEGGLFMAACALGGALSQWSVGQLSDRADRRWIIVGTSAVAAAVGLLLALESPDNVGLFYATGVRFDASALPIYSLCVAHANDGADPSTYIEVSSFLLLAFGIGAIVGPVSVSFVVEEGGHAALFVFTATIHLVVAASALLQIRFARPVPHGERAPFSGQPPISHGTQAMIEGRRPRRSRPPGQSPGRRSPTHKRRPRRRQAASNLCAVVPGSRVQAEAAVARPRPEPVQTIQARPPRTKAVVADQCGGT